MNELHTKDAERFWSSVDRTTDGACWNWKKSLRKNYGQFKARTKVYYAHRVAFYLSTGMTPEVVRHTCDNTLCCNPAHLQAGTQLENIADRVARNRSAVGPANGRYVSGDYAYYGRRSRPKG